MDNASCTAGVIAIKFQHPEDFIASRPPFYVSNLLDLEDISIMIVPYNPGGVVISASQVRNEEEMVPFPADEGQLVCRTIFFRSYNLNIGPKGKRG